MTGHDIPPQPADSFRSLPSQPLPPPLPLLYPLPDPTSMADPRPTSEIDPSPHSPEPTTPTSLDLSPPYPCNHLLRIALTPTHKFLQNILVSDIARDIVIF